MGGALTGLASVAQLDEDGMLRPRRPIGLTIMSSACTSLAFEREMQRIAEAVARTHSASVGLRVLLAQVAGDGAA